MGRKFQWKASFKGALFDNDGTLIDSDPHLIAAWVEMLIARGIENPSSFDSCLVKGTKPLVAARIMKAHFGFADEPEAFTDEWQHRSAEMVYRHAELCPGVDKTLDRFEARGIPAGVVTSGPRDYAERMLDKLHLLGRFRAFVFAECVPPDRGKPEPDPFLLGAKRLGVRPKDIVAFEDSPIGIRSIKAAGMYAVGIYRHDGATFLALAEAGADLLVAELGDFNLDWSRFDRRP